MLAFLLGLSWSMVACSSAASPPYGSPPPSKSARSLTFCTGPIPASWSAAMAKRQFTLPGVSFSVGAVSADGTLAFGYFQSAKGQGVGEVNLATGQMSIVATMPPSGSGLIWISYSDPWLVWVQGDSQTNMGAWSIHLWNRTSGQETLLASSQLPDGSYLTGQLTFPIVGHGYVAWTQPVSQTSLALVVYMLGTKERRTLDTGKVSPPVFAGKDLVWAKMQDVAKPPVWNFASFKMVNADTLRPVAVPAAIAAPQSIGSLAGSSDYLFWTQGTGSAKALALATGTVTRYGPTDVKHPFQFPVLGSHFLSWFAAVTNTVMDLKTGKAFDIPLPAAVYATDKLLVVDQENPVKKGAPPGPLSTILSVVPLSSQMHISSCNGGRGSGEACRWSAASPTGEGDDAELDSAGVLVPRAGRLKNMMVADEGGQKLRRPSRPHRRDRDPGGEAGQ